MDRRAFLSSLIATTGGLLLPYEPRRVYSFASELRVPGEERATVDHASGVMTFDGEADRVTAVSIAANNYIFKQPTREQLVELDRYVRDLYGDEGPTMYHPDYFPRPSH